jgi:hypothetical protein
MGSVTKKVEWADAPFRLARTTSAPGANYTIECLDELEFFVEATGGAKLDCFGQGICGSDPKQPGRGLCQKCATSLYAQSFDCTTTGTVKSCLFGVSGAGDLLVGWGAGAQVTYASENVG